MDFADEITALAARARGQIDQIQTEEATKNALILPFLDALGYDVFDPTEVVPEFTSDYGTKKGEKVDYAIRLDGEPIMLIECKCAGGDLSTNHASQLFRYFSVTPARIGVLTNGLRYRFFSDLEEENKMDERPFLDVDLRDVKEPQLEELKKLSKSAFDLDLMLSAAHDLKYLKVLKDYLSRQWKEPEADFVRFMLGQVYRGGRITKIVRAQLRPVVQRALHQFVSERVSARLKSALREEEANSSTAAAGEASQTERISDQDVETTEEEREAFRIVRAIMRQVVGARRVTLRDVKTYCGVLLDDNNRQPICRLHFSTSQKYLGLFDAEKNEDRVPIASLDEIYDHADRLQATATYYD